MGQLEEAEEAILRIPTTSAMSDNVNNEGIEQQGILLRLKLALKRDVLSDAIAFIHQMHVIGDLLSVLEWTHNTLIHVHALKRALDLASSENNKANNVTSEQNNIKQLLLCTIGNTCDLAVEERASALKHICPNDDNLNLPLETVFKAAWNIGQDALAASQHMSSKEAFGLALETTNCGKTDDGAGDASKAFLASFYYLQACYLTQEWSHTDLCVLRVCQRAGKRYIRAAPEKQGLLGMLRVFAVSAQTALSQWDALLQSLTHSQDGGAEHHLTMAAIVLKSTNKDVPLEIHLQCLQLLLHSFNSNSDGAKRGSVVNDLGQFAVVLRGVLQATLLLPKLNYPPKNDGHFREKSLKKPTNQNHKDICAREDDEALRAFQQVTLNLLPPLAQVYPKTELLWLTVTAYNQAMFLHTLHLPCADAQSWCECAISLCKYLPPEDRASYESRIRQGYTQILLADTTSGKQSGETAGGQVVPLY